MGGLYFSAYSTTDPEEPFFLGKISVISDKSHYFMKCSIKDFENIGKTTCSNPCGPP